ncbi:hypothetical protein [Bacillus sp. FJAT-44742]|uniref:hypothetical protein n=1 Tax=Bacillus sp. FJAT-44742 TaxID=2014005 RepID=UPI000C24EDB2|nr:hypothetical protein [Bacillus sp. FJAT-44742]
MLKSIINHFYWITAVFNWGRRTQQLFGSRRHNSGGMVFLVLGIGIGAMAYNLIRDPKRLQQVTQPITNFFRDTQLSTIKR